MITRSQYQLATGLLVAVSLHGILAAQPVPRAECFPIERLDAAKRQEAEKLLVKALDSEALYTVVGGIKPVSAGFVSLSVGVDGAELDRAGELREIFSTFHCGGEVRFDLHHFARVEGGTAKAPAVKRRLEGVVFNIPSFDSLMRRQKKVFAPWGFTPGANPMEVFMTVEYLETEDRYRGYGLMFGYPADAVEFFVKNTHIPQTRNKENPHAPVERTDKPAPVTPRRFISIPTVASAQGRFVYAVAKDHQETQDDIDLRKRSEPVLAEYRLRRARYIGEGKPGAAEMLRDWFCAGGTGCQPSNAMISPEAQQASGTPRQ